MLGRRWIGLSDVGGQTASHASVIRSARGRRETNDIGLVQRQ